MNRVPTLDSRINVVEQNAAVVPNHMECTPPLHRLGDARRQEGMSRRNVARHLGITMEEVRQQEYNTTDLPISVLHKWAKVLGLPVAELVAEPDDSLSTPLFYRAGLVRVMKTAMAILERTDHLRTKRLAQTMVDQLTELMPDLRGISAWPVVGKRRSLDELGIAAERSLSDEVFRDMVD